LPVIIQAVSVLIITAAYKTVDRVLLEYALRLPLIPPPILQPGRSAMWKYALLRIIIWSLYMK
jgi:hypothetical protein